MKSEIPPVATTPLVRDRKGEKILYIVAAVSIVVAVGSYLLVPSSWILWLSIPAGLLALLAVGAAASGCYSGECPNCGLHLSTVNKDTKPTACRSCRYYYESAQGSLQVVAPGRVHHEPVFSAQLPKRFVFPNVCCICAAPPARYDKLSGTELNPGWLLVGKISTTRVTVDGVPYCHQHREGVVVDSEHIRFSSYPYMREFCELNGLVPGPKKSFWDELDEQQEQQEAVEERRQDGFQADPLDETTFSGAS